MALNVAHLLVPEILSMLRAGEIEALGEACSEFHGADLVSIYKEIEEEEEQIVFFGALHLSEQIDVFENLTHNDQVALIDALPPSVRRAVLNELSPDDRAWLFDELPDEVSDVLLAELRPLERSNTLALLEHDDDTAGRLMTPEYLAVHSDKDIAHAFEEIRLRAAQVETIYLVYVIDSEGKLVGVLSLRDMLAASPEDKVREIMTREVIHVEVDMDQEELAETMQRYDLLAIPVTEHDGALVGIVTFDDIQDVLEEEASEDILRMHGVAAEMHDYFHASILSKLKQRMIVLASLAVVSIASVMLQQYYNPLISRISILAVFLTLLAGSSGNCGTQIAGIVIRAQSVLEPDKDSMSSMIMREMAVGTLMSLLMAAAVSGLGLLLLRSADQSALGGFSHIDVALVVGFAMFIALTTINLIGGLIPLFMKRVGLDPALTAGPFITTAADIMTVLIYFNMAAWLLPRV